VAETSQDAPFLKACRGEPTPFTPIWLMRQAGRYMREYRELRAKVPFLELVKTPELATRVTVEAALKLGVDAAIIFSDILVILEPLGFEVTFEKGDGPKIANPIRDAAALERVRELDPAALDYVARAIQLTRAALPAHVPLLGFAGAPFTLASYAIEGGGSKDHAATKAFLHRDPGAFRELLSRLARAVGVFLSRQVSAGADAVQLFDSWAGTLPPRDYREHVLPHSAAAIAGVRPRVPVIHFGTGTGAFLEDFARAGAEVTGLDSTVELGAGWRRAGTRAVMGNLDPAVLLAGRAAIEREALRVLEQAEKRPGHIFNLGHGVSKETPVEDVIFLVDRVHELSRAK
jgi:uroporphyrinogen decarboxylase